MRLNFEPLAEKSLREGIEKSDDVEFALLLSLLGAAQAEMDTMEILSHDFRKLIKVPMVHQKSKAY